MASLGGRPGYISLRCSSGASAYKNETSSHEYAFRTYISFIMNTYTHTINGKPVTSSNAIDVINPATQQTIAQVPVATKEQVSDTIVHLFTRF
jgi:hypothetical protein